jgi:sugar phosphate isomerase/epimerase
MNRRKFLVGSAASAAAGFAALGVTGVAQAPAAGGQAPASGGRQGAAAGRGRGLGAPANVPAAKLARVSIMTLDFSQYRIPANGTPATPTQTIATVFEFPKMYVETYGVHNIEFQIGDLRPSETDPTFIKEMTSKLDEYKMTMTQINMEIGAAEGMTADAAGRQKGLDHLKQWMDIADQYGCKRLMLNQNQNALTKDKRADAVAYMKAAADAARPHGIKISVETRGVGGPTEAELGMKPWEFMIGIIKDAGANSNVDIGNVGAANQKELDDCIKAWFPFSSGNMHIKSSPNWDMGAAVRLCESMGYKGLYSLEIQQGHEALRIGYNQVLANIGNVA